ncbi:hypothetical protein G6M89_02035 [Natronolimnobius sp. AArcel1]|uniref:hypothetical protein n=1 Tax=Natronolimnobius sp. AArcel1 TaxID=1679093 RepID=UPI0013E9F614|nr:hypothetical protein [Natronolimnobius sp. AArcel1]NGM67799.1 hypothetical protein [Natronolimnobius sp. AArcel1]
MTDAEEYDEPRKQQHNGTQIIRRALDNNDVRHIAGRLLEYSVLLLPGVRAVYWRLAPEFYGRRYNDDLSQFDHPPHPFKLIWIDPNMIERFSPRINWKQNPRYDVGVVLDDDWDQQPLSDVEGVVCSERLEETLLYKALERRIHDNVEWEETEFYRALVSRTQLSNPGWYGCLDVADVRDRCRYLDDLTKSLDTVGYKTQADLRETPPSLTDQTGFGFFNERVNEIAADIDRDGELLLAGNRNRLIISQLLGIESVPVFVAARHEQWMAHRETVAQAKRKTTHPDLQDLPHIGRS